MNALAAVAILAGGGSRRMGRDKAHLIIDGETLLHRSARLAATLGVPVLVIGREAPIDWDLPAVRFLADDHPGFGPLGGIATALHGTGGATLAIACDLPRLTDAALRWMADAWARSPAISGLVPTRDEQVEPLFAVYADAVLPLIDRELSVGRRACHALIASAGFARIAIPAAHQAALINCNTPEDWRRIAP